jgi:hypothetical protein
LRIAFAGGFFNPNSALGQEGLRLTAAYRVAKESPAPLAVQPPEMGQVVAVPQVGGLHHRYERRAA